MKTLFFDGISSMSIGTVIIFLLILLLYMFYYLTRLGKENKKILKEKEYYESISRKDAMCGVYNKKVLEELLREELMKKPPDTLGAVVILDIDELKQINDRYGHMQGDRAIVETANVLRESFKEPELVGRIGGDEFMVYIPNLEGEIHLIIRLEHLLNKLRLLRIGEKNNIEVHCSIGAVIADKITDFDVLYHWADCALYSVKRNTKNGFALYDESMGMDQE
ncbi:MAG: GGDEF domain-containing protein [Lachnospiraceae bacterium]